MTDDRLDRVIQLGLEGIRGIEPSNVEIQTVLRRATQRSARASVPRRFVAAFVSILVLTTGTAFAIPQSREALLDAFGAFEDFLSGGPPPGEPVPAGEPEGVLNWFTGSDYATGAVIAQVGQVRLVAYRNRVNGLACLGYGLALDDCRTDNEWNDELSRTFIVLRGPLPEPDARGRLPLVGITADDVTAVEIRYADGSAERADDVSHGFVLFADGTRTPAELIAYGGSGAVVQTIDVRDLQWTLEP